MEYKIVADSCCDLTPELKKELGVISIPLIMTLDEKCFTDDEHLNLPEYMRKMKEHKGKIGSASPPPLLYKEAFEGKHTSFAVTISSNLSGSYNSAVIGKNMAEEDSVADVYVFDSKSASAGEALIALKISKLINEGLRKTEIVTAVETFISEMKTYFVLSNFDNLMKNGRMSKIKGTIISALGIKALMGADAEGNIALFSQARGYAKVIEKLADTIKESGKNTEGESVVITHCNNPGLAEKLVNAIKERYSFKEIFVFPTNGLSSMYANDQGIIMAF